MFIQSELPLTNERLCKKLKKDLDVWLLHSTGNKGPAGFKKFLHLIYFRIKTTSSCGK